MTLFITRKSYCFTQGGNVKLFKAGDLLHFRSKSTTLIEQRLAAGWPSQGFAARKAPKQRRPRHFQKQSGKPVAFVSM